MLGFTFHFHMFITLIRLDDPVGVPMPNLKLVNVQANQWLHTIYN